MSTWSVDQIKISYDQTCINGRWVAARPENWKRRTLWQRLSEAWKVFTGELDSLRWPCGQ